LGMVAVAVKVAVMGVVRVREGLVGRVVKEGGWVWEGMVVALAEAREKDWEEEVQEALVGEKALGAWAVGMGPAEGRGTVVVAETEPLAALECRTQPSPQQR